MADLSGLWLGTYWQRKQPVRFEMSLIQGDNTLTGRVLDDNYLGEASLRGKVMGRSICFHKSYLISSPHSVDYIGTISEDGNRMQGNWKIDFLSGKWEARRTDDNLSSNKAISRFQKISLSSLKGKNIHKS